MPATLRQRLARVHALAAWGTRRTAVLAIPLSHLAGYEANNCSRAGNHDEQERVRHKHGATFLLRLSHKRQRVRWGCALSTRPWRRRDSARVNLVRPIVLGGGVTLARCGS